ncbi:Ankyrin repeat and BTB/POZ domain-containing protein BTBD11-A [Cyphomyrmex costatus]|uniref:Ankyrin repeat and BTB/POZ domain-containing protein BTBD11-A n=1 Tax=Cyphomyrmex costatus TaxID=456900 RepID=A0A151IAB1_9HYME|nr:Ankyrin repeat and BTB/POZ domain-containing protein BTBD11-A [Cyphomyrmex costatus]
MSIDLTTETFTNPIRETSTKNNNKMLLQQDIHHCRTECFVKMINYVWSITDFWNICNFMSFLTSSQIKEESYKITMHIDKKSKLYFLISDTVPEAQINISRYQVYIQSTKGAILCTGWKRFYFINDPLYEVCLETIRLNEATCLPNNTLSIYFKFELYKKIIHFNICENITDIQLKRITTNFPSDKSNSFVTLVVEGKPVFVNKSLLCAASSVLNKMLEEHNKDAEEEAKDKMEICGVPYNIFRIIILYVKSKGHFELYRNILIDNNNTWIHLLKATHRFDINDLKLKCEKHLIEFITKHNVLIYLNIAMNNNATYLTTYTKKFIRLHFDDIRCINYFLMKIKSNPELLFDICKEELLEENASYVKYKGK